MGLFFVIYLKYKLFLSFFLADGLHDYGILFAIPLELQEIQHQSFSMAQPFYLSSDFSWIANLAMLTPFLLKKKGHKRPPKKNLMALSSNENQV